MVTVIQERHIMLDMEIGHRESDTRTTHNTGYGDRSW